MKKILTITALILFGILIFTSCSGGKGDNESDATNKNQESPSVKTGEVLNTINYSKFKIGNRDKNYFKMVDGGSADVKFGEFGSIEVTAEFEIVKTFTGKIGDYSTEQAWVNLIALDKNGNTIELSSTTNGDMGSGDSRGARFADFLRGEPGYTAKFEFSGRKSDNEKTIEAAKNIAGFKVLADGINY